MAICRSCRLRLEGQQTGVQFRLPTDEEWAYAAGSRFHDEEWPDFEADDPAQRWLARYEAESERSAPTALRPIVRFRGQ
jgi:formylglycine-generating enzyme required for sulfatase activity